MIRQKKRSAWSAFRNGVSHDSQRDPINRALFKAFGEALMERRRVS